jgi:hypothetical protein
MAKRKPGVMICAIKDHEIVFYAASNTYKVFSPVALVAAFSDPAQVLRWIGKRWEE